VQEAMVRNWVYNNNLIINNLSHLFEGDPAQYYKGGSTNDFRANLFKRLKANVSPMEKGQMPDYKAGYIKDFSSYPGGMFGLSELRDKENIEKYKPDSDLSFEEKYQELIDQISNDNDNENNKESLINTYFPNTKDYFNTPHADAQELWHYTHHFNFLKAQGIITESQRKDLTERSKNSELTPEDSQYLTVIKPLYVSDVKSSTGHRIRKYVKSSAIVLLPQEIKGTEWEKMFNKMESQGIESLIYDSAVKVGMLEGAPEIFDLNGNFTAQSPDIVIPTSVHPGSGLGNQLNIPAEFKTKINASIQYHKNLRGDIANIWDNKLGKLEDKIQERDDLREELLNYDNDKLIKELSNSQGTLDLDKFRELIVRELKERNIEPNAANIIQIAGEDGYKRLIYPLYATQHASKFESLVLSLFRKGGVSSMKRTGSSDAQATSIGLRSLSQASKAELKSIREMGSDFDIDKLYQYMPSKKAIYKVDPKNPELVKFIENFESDFKDTFKDNDNDYQDIQDQISSLKRSQETSLLNDYEDIVDELIEAKQKDLSQLDNLRKDILDLKKEEIREFKKSLPKDSFVKFKSSNKLRDKIVDQIFDIEFDIFSTLALKKLSTDPLDTSATEYEDYIKSLSEIITGSSQDPNLGDIGNPLYQMSKVGQGHNASIGIGQFALQLTFNNVIQKKNVSTKSNYKLQIQSLKDSQNNSSGHLSDNKYSTMFDGNTVKALKAYYSKHKKVFANKIAGVDSLNQSLILGENKYNVERIKESLLKSLPEKYQVPIVSLTDSEFNKDVLIANDLSKDSVAYYTGEELRINSDRINSEDLVTGYGEVLINDLLNLVSQGNTEAAEVFDNLFNQGLKIVSDKVLKETKVKFKKNNFKKQIILQSISKVL